MKRQLMISTILLAASAGAFAQASAATVQRDVQQQQRIEQGLKSGALTTREAAGLEREESRVDHLQARALRDGKVTPAEQARLARAQNQVSRDIHAAKTNRVNGNPQSASSQRMQADVQRNVNQEQRIANGLHDGSLTNHEAARLERGQARVDRREAVAGRDGHVGTVEQQRVQRAENVQSRRVHRERTDAQLRKG